MKFVQYILMPFAVTLVAFWAWHTPLRGPLTQSEVDAFLRSGSETGGSAWAVPDAFETFLRNDDGRPFVMINLMELRDVADYPEGAGIDNRTGAEADAEYGQSVLPLLLARGSYPIVNATRDTTILSSLGSDAGRFETLAIVRYRSRRDLLAMIGSDAFLRAEVHKWASLENTLVAPARIGPSLSPLGYAPLFLLLGCAIFGGILMRRSKGKPA